MIHKLDLNEFTVFKKASLEFGNRINVLIGENGSGKTQILKFLYATLNLLPACLKTVVDARLRAHVREDEESGLDVNKLIWNSVAEPKDTEVFKSVFNVGLVADLVNLDFRNKQTKGLDLNFQNLKRTGDNSDVNVHHVDLKGVESKNSIVFQSGKKDYKYNITLRYLDVIADNLFIPWDNMPIPSGLLPNGLFLPTRELLTIFPHYLSLRKMYKLPYDSTYDDAIARLGLPPMNENSAEFETIVQKLENAIDGRIFLKDEKFYFHPNSALEGQNLDINMTAEGWRKLGTLLQLLRNGGLRSGMVLLWDEPEANLNPKLICLIAQVLIELSKLDIQIFITTHSLFLLREIDMLSKEKGTYEQGDVRYFNFLGKGKVEQGNAPEDLNKILLLDESLAQSDRYMEMED